MDFNNFYISGNGNKCPLWVSYLLTYFACDIHVMSLSRSWHWWAVTGSAGCVTWLGAVADWWRNWRMANMLTCLCSCQWWTVWTYLVTVNLFSLYLMNLVFHTTPYAVGNILRVHYKSMKCHVSFSQGSISTLYRWGEHVFCVCVKMPTVHSIAKIIKIKQVFPELWSQMYWYVFYESQCRMWANDPHDGHAPNIGGALYVKPIEICWGAPNSPTDLSH